VPGDLAVWNDRTAVITSRLACNVGEEMWCLKFARGKRQCLFRREFEVVLP
jgi:hypothetical protein